MNGKTTNLAYLSDVVNLRCHLCISSSS